MLEGTTKVGPRWAGLGWRRLVRDVFPGVKGRVKEQRRQRRQSVPSGRRSVENARGGAEGACGWLSGGEDGMT